MAYAFKRTLTIDHTQVGTTNQTNFPVLVKLDATNCAGTLKVTGPGGNIQHTVTQSGGKAVSMPADLIFTSDSAGTTKIPWEIEAYDGVNGTLWAWVQIATVSHTANTVFYCFYDDATITTQQNTGSFAPSAVWDANYLSVWHLADSAATKVVIDSTANSNNGTSARNTSIVTTTGGQVSSGFTNTSASSDNTQSINASSYFANGNTVTFEFWYKPSTVTAQQDFAQIANSVGDGNASILWDNNSGAFAVYRGSGWTSTLSTFTLNTWYHIVTVMKFGTPGSLLITVNGSTVINDANPVGAPSRNLFYLGAGYFGYCGGVFDECRISTSARTADYATACYNNQNNPESFVTAGSQVSTSINFTISAAPVAAILTAPAPSVVPQTNTQASLAALSLSPAATSVATTSNVSLAAPAASLVIAPAVPTLSVVQNVTVGLSTATLTLSVAVPTVAVTTNAAIAASVVAATLTTAAPTVAAVQNATIAANPAAMTLAATAPSVTIIRNAAIAVSPATLSLSTTSPLIVAARNILTMAAAAVLVLATSTTTVQTTANAVAAANPASVVCTGLAPVCSGTAVVAAPVGSMILTGRVPVVFIRINTPPEYIIDVPAYKRLVAVGPDVRTATEESDGRQIIPTR